MQRLNTNVLHLVKVVVTCACLEARIMRETIVAWVLARVEAMPKFLKIFYFSSFVAVVSTFLFATHLWYATKYEVRKWQHVCRCLTQDRDQLTKDIAIKFVAWKINLNM